MTKRGNHILMFVMRKFDRELPFVLWPQGLIRIVRLSEGKTHVFTRSSAQMTDGANCRASSRACLASEKLLAMAFHTRVMIGKIRNVRKVTLRCPCGWNFVAR